MRRKPSVQSNVNPEGVKTFRVFYLRGGIHVRSGSSRGGNRSNQQSKNAASRAAGGILGYVNLDHRFVLLRWCHDRSDSSL